MDRRKEYAEEEENLAAKSAAFVQYLTRRGYLITKQVSSDEAAIRRQEFAKKAYHNTEMLLASYRDLVWAVESIPDQIASELEMPFAELDELISRIDLEFTASMTKAGKSPALPPKAQSTAARIIWGWSISASAVTPAARTVTKKYRLEPFKNCHRRERFSRF